MWTRTPVTELLGVDLPIVLAPLAGGPGTPELAAAVSAAGGLGMLGLGYARPDRARADIRRVRELTGRPFGANLFVPQPYRVDAGEVDRAVVALRPYHRELGLPEAPPVDRYAEDFDEQLDVVLAERVPVVGFAFGVPPPGVVGRVKRAGAVLIGTATSVPEGLALQDAGVDLVCGQGAEAGGHRGGFLPGPAGPAGDLIGLVALVPALVDALAVPVVAAGGIMDGRGIAAALALGAGAAQLGTAFLRCPQAGTSPPYRAALAEATGSSTVITSAFSGRPARGVANALSRALDEVPGLPGYPVMNALTRSLRARAAEAGRADLLSLWAGQGVALGRELPAGELVRLLAEETRQVLAGLAAPRAGGTSSG